MIGMRIGLVGINHKQADLQLREKLARTCQRRFGSDQSAHSDHSFILLSTCNRTEIYFSSLNLPETHTYILNILRNDLEGEFDQKLYSYFNDDCFYHLARVTCGLDSAILFETEIQGQVKNAYEKACQYASFPSDVHFLFQKCLHIGKKMRSTMPIERDTQNIESAIFSMGIHLFKSKSNLKVLFIGASDINLKILQFLKKKEIEDITICNRTFSTAQHLSIKYDLRVLDWKNLSEWDRFDWIILGTKSPHFLIGDRICTKRIFSKKLIIDLSVPRNVDPHLRKNPFITLLNIDQINRMVKIRKKGMTNFICSRERFVENLTSLLLKSRKESTCSYELSESSHA